MERREFFSGQTPLHIAATRGHTDVVKLLLDAGANKAAMAGGEQAIHRAARGNHAAVVQLLLDAGVDVETPAIAHPLSENITVMATMRRVQTTTLGIAAAAGSTEVLSLLLEAGAKRDVECVGRSVKGVAPSSAESHGGHTPLTAAASAGHEGVLRVLLEAGADPHARAVNGLSARGCAMKLCRFRLVAIMDAIASAQPIATGAPLLHATIITSEMAVTSEEAVPEHEAVQSVQSPATASETEGSGVFAVPVVGQPVAPRVV